MAEACFLFCACGVTSAELSTTHSPLRAPPLSTLNVHHHLSLCPKCCLFSVTGSEKEKEWVFKEPCFQVTHHKTVHLFSPTHSHTDTCAHTCAPTHRHTCKQAHAHTDTCAHTCMQAHAHECRQTRQQPEPSGHWDPELSVLEQPPGGTAEQPRSCLRRGAYTASRSSCSVLELSYEK